MNKKYIEINNEINKLLQSGLRLAMQYEQEGKKKEAVLILKITSEVATKRIQSSGLQVALTEFWNDKKALANNYN